MSTPDVWKKYDPEVFFQNLKIPDDWNSLEDFVDWYMESKIPILIPWNAEVIMSDDAVAICIFKKGHYQVEFYLEYPKMYIRKHAHPRMEVIVMDLGGGNMHPKSAFDVSKIWGRTFKKLMPGDEHGGDSATVLSKGFVTLAFQRWENIEEMSSAAIQWKGELQGPIQEQLIKKKKVNAVVDEKYADVSSDTSLKKY